MDIRVFVSTLREYGVRSGSGVPCSFFKPLVNAMGADPALDYIGASSEGEAVAIAAGMVTAGRPSFALMQNSGLGNAINPLTSMVTLYGIPVISLVSRRGQPGEDDQPQHEHMGRITSELLQLCGVETHTFRPEAFEAQLARSLQRGVPVAFVVEKGSLVGGPPADPVELCVHLGTAPEPIRTLSPQGTREDALRALLPLLNSDVDRPAVVSTTGKLSRELFELDDREHDKANRFYMVGSMGCATGLGLGIARAWRGKVVVLDGDGALLMKLGSLATAGMMGLPNFHHVVFDNGAHDSTGGQPTASPGCDFATMARAAGYRCAETLSDLSRIRPTLEKQMGEGGPTFLRVLVNTGARKNLGRPTITPRAAYVRFRDWLRGV